MRPALVRRLRSSRRRLFAAGAAGLGVIAAAGLVAADQAVSEPVSFGVFPYLPTLEIGRQFGPMATALSAVLDRPVELRTKGDFAAFGTALHAARYDIALLHPFLYGEIAHVQDYRPLARLEDDLTAVVVAPAERTLRGFDDLRGDILAVPPALSAVAKLVELELRRAGLDGPDGVPLAYYRTKTACLHAVATGQATACAIPSFLLGQINGAAGVTLEAKFSTASIPGLLFVGHGRLGGRKLDRLQQTLVGWKHEPDGRRLLAVLGWSGLAPSSSDDYDLAELRLLVE